MAVEEAPGGAGSPETGPDGRRWASWCRSTDLPTPGSRNGGSAATLIVFIDDATSRLMALRFAEAETTEAYVRTLRGYLDQHVPPGGASTSDKHSIFRVNQKDREGDLTQFTRVLKTLDIQPIHANTPQAKGRVERANQTLQDRLVKELRTTRHRRHPKRQRLPARVHHATNNQRFSSRPQKPPRTPTATCSMTQPLSTSSSPSIPLRKLSRNLTWPLPQPRVPNPRPGPRLPPPWLHRHRL